MFLFDFKKIVGQLVWALIRSNGSKIRLGTALQLAQSVTYELSHYFKLFLYISTTQQWDNEFQRLCLPYKKSNTKVIASLNLKSSSSKDIMTYLFGFKMISEHENNFLCQWEAVNSRNVHKDTSITVPNTS